MYVGMLCRKNTNRQRKVRVGHVVQNSILLYFDILIHM